VVARVPSQERLCGICVTGAGFLLVHRFPLPVLIPPNAPLFSSTIRIGIVGPVVTGLPSGLSLTSPRINKLYIYIYIRLIEFGVDKIRNAHKILALVNPEG
jgi:hypothetical protein